MGIARKTTANGASIVFCFGTASMKSDMLYVMVDFLPVHVNGRTRPLVVCSAVECDCVTLSALLGEEADYWDDEDMPDVSPVAGVTP